MEIIINTLHGTYIVPPDKADQLVSWLQQNAVKQGQQHIGEIKQQDSSYVGRQLINE